MNPTKPAMASGARASRVIQVLARPWGGSTVQVDVITGIIDHRILLNYRVEPRAIDRRLPAGFLPKLVKGFALGGICQVSVSRMRPRGLPEVIGFHSHNAAHRIAVLQGSNEGVYVPRRDTDSRMNQLVGGRVFPGVYTLSEFAVDVLDDNCRVQITDRAGERLMAVDGHVTDRIQAGSVFGSLDEASAFFKAGDTGWSPSKTPGVLDTIELWTREWCMEPFKVTTQYSSYFSDLDLFPAGSVQFDSAFIMRRLDHEWRAHEGLACVCS
jgi:hypothetical protein